MGGETRRNLLDFHIDRYVNPYVPHSRLYLLPKPVAHFLGRREAPTQEPPAVLQWISMFVATIAGLCAVSATYVYAPGLSKYNPPVIVASLGASAVLDYNTIRSPLAQPRNTVIGHTLAALIGVCIAKLFQLNSDFDNITWVSGAVACACASLVMSITNTVHPPGGATAILASTEASIVSMGWIFVPFVLIGSLLMLGVALLLNNVLRQYPLYWWTPEECGSELRHPRHAEDEVEKAPSETDSEQTLHKTTSHVESVYGLEGVRILADRIQIPPECQLLPGEVEVLEKLRQRLIKYEEAPDLDVNRHDYNSGPPRHHVPPNSN